MLDSIPRIRTLHVIYCYLATSSVAVMMMEPNKFNKILYTISAT